MCINIANATRFVIEEARISGNIIKGHRQVMQNVQKGESSCCIHALGTMTRENTRNRTLTSDEQITLQMKEILEISCNENAVPLLMVLNAKLLAELSGQVTYRANGAPRGKTSCSMISITKWNEESEAVQIILDHVGYSRSSSRSAQNYENIENYD